MRAKRTAYQVTTYNVQTGSISYITRNAYSVDEAHWIADRDNKHNQKTNNHHCSVVTERI